MTDERRYDEREVGLILRRVAELQEREGGKSDERGLTRGEIEEVVTELGISRALVARAAADISLQDLRNRPSWRLGGKTDLMFEEVVGPIDESLHTRMLEVLRRHLGEPGKLQREGGALIWSTGESGRRIHFTAVEHAGRTTLRLEESMHSAAVGTVGLSGFAGGFLGFMLMVPLKALVVKSLLLLLMGPLVVVGVMLGWLIGRLTWKRSAQAREEMLRRAFTELMTVAAEARKPPVLALTSEPHDDDDDAE